MVSVIVLSFNRSAFVSQALDSLRSQTFPDWRLVFSDCSTQPNEMRRIREIAEEFSRTIRQTVQFTHHDKQMLQSEHLRFTLDQVRTPFVAFLHDDDAWLPHHLQQAVDWLQADSRNALAISDAEIIDEKGSLTGRFLSGGKPPVTKYQWASCFLRSFFGSFSGFVARASLLADFPQFENGAIDIHFALHVLSRRGRLHGFAQPSYRYRVHQSGASVSNTCSLLHERHRLRLWLAQNHFLQYFRIYPAFPLLVLKSWLALRTQRNEARRLTPARLHSP